MPLRTDAAPADGSLPIAKKTSSSGASATGFILMDSAQTPVAFNAEAMQILSYPDKPRNIARSEVFLADRVRTRLLNPLAVDHQSSFITEFRSGNRHYRCRAFALDSPAQGSSHPAVAILLERNFSGLIALSEITKQFKLTPREREAVGLLLEGHTCKEMADRMKISPHTVRAFLKMVMIKMGASTRSGIIGKIVGTKP